MLINIFVRGLVLKKKKKRLHIGYICWCNQDWEHFEQIKKDISPGAGAEIQQCLQQENKAIYLAN